MLPRYQKMLLTKAIKNACLTSLSILKIKFTTYKSSAVVTLSPKKLIVRLRIGQPYASENLNYDQQLTIPSFSDYIIRNNLFFYFLELLNLEIQRKGYCEN